MAGVAGGGGQCAISILHKYDYNIVMGSGFYTLTAFQFYISTITMIVAPSLAICFVRFQFYISTITMAGVQDRGAVAGDFNST